MTSHRRTVAVLWPLLLALWPLVLIVGLTMLSAVDADGDLSTVTGPPIVRLAEADAIDVIEEATPAPDRGTRVAGSERRPHGRLRGLARMVRPEWFGRARPIRGP